VSIAEMSPIQGPVQGVCIYSKPLAPEWLGGGICAESQMYTQTKIHAMKLVYKSVSDPLMPGAIALCFTNDVDRPFPVGGTAALQSASEGPYAEGKVVDSFSLDINPVDMNVTYDTDGGSNDAIQGMIRVLTTSKFIAAAAALGNLYIEFDVEFYGPVLAQLTSTPYSGYATIDYNAYVPTAGNALRLLSSSVTTAANACILFGQNGSAVPIQDGMIYSCRVVTSSGTAIAYTAQNLNSVSRSLLLGDTIFMRTEALGIGNDWTNRTIVVLLFNTLKSAQGFVSGNINGAQISDGQLTYPTTTVAFTGTASIFWEAVTV